MNKVIISHTAGGIVLNAKGQVAVVNQDHVSWSLPKGHIEEGEKPVEAAVREIEEETGITQLELIEEFQPYERFKIGQDGIGEDKSDKKIIHMFLFTTNQTEFAPTDPRHSEVRWVEIDQVADLLTHERDKQFFQSVSNLILQKLPNTNGRFS